MNSKDYNHTKIVSERHRWKNIEKKCAEEEGSQLLNPFAFEDYCGNCDNFPYADYKENGNPIGYGYGSYAFHECPFKDKVTDNTKWKILGCKYFCD